MMKDWRRGGELLRGPLLDQAETLPLNLTAVLCDLRPRFIAKGTAGRGYRAIARNGRVLLAADRPLEELAGRTARVRLQVWHRCLLPGDTPAPYGVLVYIGARRGAAPGPSYQARLDNAHVASGDLILDVGGGLAVAFYR